MRFLSNSVAIVLDFRCRVRCVDVSERNTKENETETTFQFWMTLAAWCPENDVEKAMIRVSINQVTNDAD